MQGSHSDGYPHLYQISRRNRDAILIFSYFPEGNACRAALLRQ